MGNIIYYISTFFNLVVIGVIIRLFFMLKAVLKEKEDVLLVRLKGIEEELDRTKKWADKKQEKVEKERDEIREQMQR